MGGICNTNWGRWEIQDFGQENWREETILESRTWMGW